MTPEIIQNKLKAGEFEDINYLADFIVEIWSSISTASVFVTDNEIAFANKWRELRRVCGTDKECDLVSKDTEEFRLMKKSQNEIKYMTEIARSLKKKLVRLEEEKREAKY